MASGVTRLSDVVVPELFAQYVLEDVYTKSAIVQSGAVVLDNLIQSKFTEGGSILTMPSYRNLDYDEENVSTDNPDSFSTPQKIGSSTQIAVQLNRNNSWSAMDLAAELAGSDPMGAIRAKVSDYWLKRMQAVFLAECAGIFASNDANSGGDMTLDISGTATPGISAEAFNRACGTMGDQMNNLRLAAMDSVLFIELQNQNLIEFIPNSINTNAMPTTASTPTFLGKTVIVDDSLGADANGNHQVLIFGNGVFGFAAGNPKVPVEVERKASAGDGGGQDILHNRVTWCYHPYGWRYVGPSGVITNVGHPTNADLSAAASWEQAYQSRKQIAIARLICKPTN